VEVEVSVEEIAVEELDLEVLIDRDEREDRAEFEAFEDGVYASSSKAEEPVEDGVE
jgi:hypothetical protein